MKFASRLIAFGIIAGAFAMASTGAAQQDNPATKLLNRDVARHKQFLEIAKKGNVDVVFIGDSITQGWGNNAAWKKNFEPLKAANFGISGDQTGHVLWRITEGGELDTIKPKVAVVMIGTNNTGGHSAEQIAGGIKLIVETIHKKTSDTKVLLLGVFPRGSNKTFEFTPQSEKVKEINKIIAKLDDGKKVKYLDIGNQLLKDGKLSKEIMPDALHLSAKGYDIWAEAITPTLKDMLK